MARWARWWGVPFDACRRSSRSARSPRSGCACSPPSAGSPTGCGSRSRSAARCGPSSATSRTTRRCARSSPREGFPASWLERTREPAIKAALVANTAAAQAAGVFGVPTFVVDGAHLFWGQDRLELVARALEGRAWTPPGGELVSGAGAATWACAIACAVLVGAEWRGAARARAPPPSSPRRRAFLVVGVARASRRGDAFARVDARRASCSARSATCALLGRGRRDVPRRARSRSCSATSPTSSASRSSSRRRRWLAAAGAYAALPVGRRDRGARVAVAAARRDARPGDRLRRRDRRDGRRRDRGLSRGGAARSAADAAARRRGAVLRLGPRGRARPVRRARLRRTGCGACRRTTPASSSSRGRSGEPGDGWRYFFFVPRVAAARLAAARGRACAPPSSSPSSGDP